MSADEIIKHIPEIASATKVVAAAVPFTAIVKRMLGPAADELAEMWKDQVRLYRYERQLKCVEKAEKMAKDAGFTPQAVPPKILFPLLEGASFEENEDLHTMWAALLANAASSSAKANTEIPSFIAILRQMSPSQATILDKFHHLVRMQKLSERLGRFGKPAGVGDTTDRPGDFSGPDVSLEENVLFQFLGANSKNEARGFMSHLDGLEAALLIRRNYEVIQQDLASINFVVKVHYTMTERGQLFVKACQPPPSKKPYTSA